MNPKQPGAHGTSTAASAPSAKAAAQVSKHHLEYAPNGRRLDVYRPEFTAPPTPGNPRPLPTATPPQQPEQPGNSPHPPATSVRPLPTVVLWHGVGPDERDVLEPLARAVAARGLLVLVPDWRSDAPDGGRDHLLRSLDFTRRNAGRLGGDGTPYVLAGWSAGAGAALAVAQRPDIVSGPGPKAVVCLAGRYDIPARTTGTAPLDDLRTGAAPTVPVHLVHGTRDTLLDPGHSRDLAHALRAAGTPVTLHEPDTDHAGVVMTAYEPDADRCVPAEVEHAVRGGQLVADVLADASRDAPGDDRGPRYRAD